jgi:hypothetical protein
MKNGIETTEVEKRATWRWGNVGARGWWETGGEGYDPRAILSLWPRGGCPAMEWKVDERCTSTIESSCDRVKNSSSPSYGDELELIYVHKTTNTDDPTKKQVNVNPP